ncbi:hypothetical protein AB0D67_37630 [Streptosporangium sp. NPDC048047]|uniref:hypothetical protein n=1 Tax=Streptosporangium sp. NPDC048047 TaxID=3155748 RepID=UPI00342D58B9
MNAMHPDLNLTDPRKGYTHFVLYTEPSIGIAGAAWNATLSIERHSPYVQEWLSRLERCEPNPLHATLVDNQEIPKLFHRCVDEDKDSPSAIKGVGCTCRRTWYDMEFGLPVVGRHFRGSGGVNDRWTYTTYTPLDLRPSDVFSSVVIDHGLFWVRTAAGVLSFLPQRERRGYGAGPDSGTGGSTAFAAYLQQLVDSDGRNTAASVHPSDDLDPRIHAWVRSEAAGQRQELTLRDLEAICRC